ncbi:MAG TPA: hypothetical protein VFR18_25750, partial [Terriglobia bacterium]|nr:hypothetical protein [Terriglobia bacterium]
EELEVGTINGSGAYGARTLQWFPNGLSLLVIDGVDNNQRKRFRQIDVKTGEVKLLFEGPWAIWTAALAADGKSVFYSLRGDGDHRLIRRHLNTGEETELFNVKSPGAGLFGLIASPDGTSLAFTRNLELAKRALFVLPIEGGVPRELHRSEWLDGKWIAEIGWTPDSRKLIVTADAKSLFVIPAGGGSLEPLGVTMQEVTNPGISPDGQRIVFGGRTRTEQLWVVRNLFHDQAKSR